MEAQERTNLAALYRFYVERIGHMGILVNEDEAVSHTSTKRLYVDIHSQPDSHLVLMTFVKVLTELDSFWI